MKTSSFRFFFRPSLNCHAYRHAASDDPKQNVNVGFNHQVGNDKSNMTIKQEEAQVDRPEISYHRLFTYGVWWYVQATVARAKIRDDLDSHPKC